MEMRYRGVAYSFEPMLIEQLESDRQGTYRGQSYNVPRFGQPPVLQPSISLMYRGVAYHTTPSAGTEVVRTKEQLKNSKPIPTPVQMQSVAVRGSAQTAGVTELHRRNILQSLQHRMLVAKAKGDRQLMNDLEQELQMFS
jgi:Domain of unknown function (DUF4278)